MAGKQSLRAPRLTRRIADWWSFVITRSASGWWVASVLECGAEALAKTEQEVMIAFGETGTLSEFERGGCIRSQHAVGPHRLGSDGVGCRAAGEPWQIVDCGVDRPQSLDSSGRRRGDAIAPRAGLWRDKGCNDPYFDADGAAHFLYRKPSSSDRRQCLVFLAERGRRARDTTLEELTPIARSLSSVLDSEQLFHAIGFLSILKEEMGAAGAPSDGGFQ